MTVEVRHPCHFCGRDTEVIPSARVDVGPWVIDVCDDCTEKGDMAPGDDGS